MTRSQTPAPGSGDGRTRRIPAATRRIPLPPTQQIPAPTQRLPESPQEGPTRAMRQVRALTENGEWPAIPMLPVIRPEEEDPPAPRDRARGHGDLRALREVMERLEDPDVPAWPEREEPDERFRI